MTKDLFKDVLNSSDNIAHRYEDKNAEYELNDFIENSVQKIEKLKNAEKSIQWAEDVLGLNLILNTFSFEVKEKIENYSILQGFEEEALKIRENFEKQKLLEEERKKEEEILAKQKLEEELIKKEQEEQRHFELEAMNFDNRILDLLNSDRNKKWLEKLNCIYSEYLNLDSRVLMYCKKVDDLLLVENRKSKYEKAIEIDNEIKKLEKATKNEKWAEKVLKLNDEIDVSNYLQNMEILESLVRMAKELLQTKKKEQEQEEQIKFLEQKRLNREYLLVKEASENLIQIVGKNGFKDDNFEYELNELGQLCIKNLINKKLKVVTVPIGVEAINGNGFGKNKKVQEIYLPIGIKYISKTAFNDLQNLKIIEINKEAVSCDYISIDGNLYEAKGTKLIHISKGNKIKNLTLPTKCIYVCEGVFKNYKHLKTITGKNVNYIEKEAFYGCKNLVTCDFPNLFSINDKGFYGCKKLENIFMNRKALYIREAFVGCKKLQRTTSEKLKYSR